MTISYPLTIPSNVGRASFTMRMVNAVAFGESPFTFSQDVQKFDGERWECDIRLRPMERADAQVWSAFLASLKGQFGTFLMGDTNADTALGEAGGTPLVRGVGQTGDVLTIDGATASQTDWLKAGDFIQLGSGASSTLHQLLTDADTSGGVAALDIWPSMRTAPADNSAVVVSAAKGLFRLSGNSASYSTNNIAHYGISFSATESVL